MLKIITNSIWPKILEVTVVWRGPVPAIDLRLRQMSPKARESGSSDKRAVRAGSGEQQT